jgi:hypothetical protein
MCCTFYRSNKRKWQLLSARKKSVNTDSIFCRLMFEVESGGGLGIIQIYKPVNIRKGCISATFSPV